MATIPLDVAMPSRAIVVAILAVAAVGCGNTLDLNKTERLKIGMTPQEVEAILGKGGKDISSEEIASLMKEALTPKGGGDIRANPKAPKMELPDLSGARGVRWGDDKKSVTIIYMNDRVSRIFKKGL